MNNSQDENMPQAASSSRDTPIEKVEATKNAQKEDIKDKPCSSQASETTVEGKKKRRNKNKCQHDHKKRIQGNGLNDSFNTGSEDTEDSSSDEVVQELEVDPQLQNWIYTSKFLRDFEKLNDLCNTSQYQQKTLDQLFGMINDQQVLINKLLIVTAPEMP